MTNRIAVACSAAICLALIFTPSTLATITDDIDPQGAAVLVSLSNPGASLVKGWVIVTADLQVSSSTVSVPFLIPAGGQTQVVANFSSVVEEVTDVKIIEGP